MGWCDWQRLCQTNGRRSVIDPPGFAAKIRVPPSVWLDKETRFQDFEDILPDDTASKNFTVFFLAFCFLAGWGKKNSPFFSDLLMIEKKNEMGPEKWVTYINLSHALDLAYTGRSLVFYCTGQRYHGSLKSHDLKIHFNPVLSHI